jgi:hypothetical protein
VGLGIIDPQDALSSDDGPLRLLYWRKIFFDGRAQVFAALSPSA